MKIGMDINLTKVTEAVFTWVMIGITVNLALYALGLVEINFSTFLGSIGLSYVFCFLMSRVVLVNLAQHETIKTKKEKED